MGVRESYTRVLNPDTDGAETSTLVVVVRERLFPLQAADFLVLPPASLRYLVGQVGGVVQLAERFQDVGRVDGHCAAVHGVEHEAVRQALDVAVEDHPDQLGVPVDHRRARVAADDVALGHEVDRG